MIKTKLIILISLLCFLSTAKAESILVGNGKGLLYIIDTEKRTAEVTSSNDEHGNYNIKDIVIKDVIFFKGAGYRVTSIGWQALTNCEFTETVKIPNTIIAINSFAFFNCGSLKTINIPNSVLYIGFSAFAGCGSLKTIKIPKSVKEIKHLAFSYCRQLKYVYIYNREKVLLDEEGDCPFSEIASGSVLYVPKGMKRRYIASPYKKVFSRIVEI